MSIWKFILLGLIVVCLGSVALVIFYKNARSAASCGTTSPKPTIMAFGDSLVEGYGAPQGGDFVTKLSERIGVPIKNLGKNGDTTEQGLARAQMISDRPDIVIVLLGGNDALQKVPKENTKENLSRIIELFQSYQSKRIHVVLVGVIGGFPSDPYAQMFKDLAKEHNVTLVPNILSGIFGNKEYMSDQVHPNAAGYEKIAERLTPILNTVCTRK